MTGTLWSRAISHGVLPSIAVCLVRSAARHERARRPPMTKPFGRPRYIISQMTDDLFLNTLQHRDPPSRSRWDTVALIVAALAAVFSAVTQAQSHPIYAVAFLVVVAILVAFLCYRPLAEWALEQKMRARRNGVARKAWPDLLRFEKRFQGFINNDDSRNLRTIINDIGGRREEELFKLCPPDYVNTFYPILSNRRLLTRHVRESDFRIALNELIAMVASYNTEYVLKPVKRLKDNARFAQLVPSEKQYREEAIEDFRERWVRFLDDLTEFVAARNNDFEYEPYHEAISAFFERPKKLSL